MDIAETRQSRLHYFFLGLKLGLQDVRDNYSRSILGPLWITISLGVQILILAAVFGRLMSMGSEYLWSLTVGLVFWAFISGPFVEAPIVFVQTERLLKQIRFPLYLLVVRLVAKHLVILAHNLLIVCGVFFFLWPSTKLPDLWSSVLAAFFLIVLVGALCTILAIVGARFRDLAPMIHAFLMVAFYATPIIWMPGMFSTSTTVDLVLAFNPFLHFLELIRPIGLENVSWLQSASVVVFLPAICLIVAMVVYRRMAWRVVYWV